MATPDAVRAEVAKRRAEAVKLRTQGHTWQQIADKLGLASKGAAYTDVQAALAEARKDLQQSTEEFREVELERLDALTRKVQEVLDRVHPHVSAGGKIVKDDDGSKLPDAGPVLAAVDRLLRIQERRSRLLGLDQASKVEVSGQVLYAVEGINVEKLT